MKRSQPKKKSEQKAKQKAQLKAQFAKSSSPPSEIADKPKVKQKHPKRVIDDPNKTRKLVQLVVGSRNSSRQHQIPDEETLKKATLQYFAGFSIFKGTGFWQETPDDDIIEEETFSILIATTQPKKVESLARELIYIYKQKSVFVIKHEATAYFLSKKPKKRKGKKSTSPSTTASLPVTPPIVDKKTPKGKAIVTMDVDSKKQR